MRTYILFFLLLLHSYPSSAQEAGWYSVTSSNADEREYSIKLGSGTRDVNKQGDAMTVVVDRTENKKEGEITLRKWYVTDSDCKQEYGKLVALDLDGNFKFESPYARGSKSIGSFIADTICEVWASHSKKASGKSL